MDKDRLHRSLAHIAAGADKMAQAANIITHGMKNGDSPARIAKHLADYGLLVPTLPAPYTSLSTREWEWAVVDGYVNLYDGEITVFYDERDEETYATEPAPEPGEIRIADTTQGNKLAYRILAACDLKDAQDD